MRPERIRVEYSKLRLSHPEVRPRNNKFVSLLVAAGRQRRLSVIPRKHYPHVPPKVFVEPHDDLIESEHIHSSGEMCFMRKKQWDPRVHNIAFVFSICKRILRQIPRELEDWRGERRGEWNRYN